jgi:hypothetical protein
MAVARGFDVLRHAGVAPLRGHASPARERLRARALALAADEGLVDAAYSYRIVPLEAPAAPLLRAGGQAIEAPWLLPASGTLTALACAVCTIGPALEQRVRTLFEQRQPALATALDALGNELLFEVSRRAQDRLHADARRRGLSLAGELRAGDPGLALEAQHAVLQLAWADTIGVTLGAGLLMHPLKSTSFVIGAGIDLPATAWSRCDTCRSRDKCALHTRPASVVAAAGARP